MTQVGGVDVRNTTAELQARLFAAAGQAAKVGLRPGACAQAVLYVPANLVNGDVLTIDGVTFEVDIVNTDSGVNTADTAAGALTDSQNPALVTLGAAPATAINAGDLIRIENEILKVLRKLSTTEYVCARARCGTAIAAHAQNLDVFVSDAAPASNVPVGLVTTLTPAVFGPALVEEFNNLAAGGERATAKAPPASLTDEFLAHPVLLAGQQVLFTARAAGVNVAAVSEEFANSTDNVWGSATFTGGLAAGIVSFETVERVPTAAEELVGEMHFAFPFTVRNVVVQMTVTSTGQVVHFTGAIHKGYVESTDATLPATIVTLRNLGPASTAYITAFAVTNTVKVLASE